MLDVHCVAPFSLAKLATPHLVASQGSIVNVSSVVGQAAVSIFYVTQLFRKFKQSATQMPSFGFIVMGAFKISQSNVVLAYSTAKGALDSLTRALAMDLGPKGVRVNSVK